MKTTRTIAAPPPAVEQSTGELTPVRPVTSRVYLMWTPVWARLRRLTAALALIAVLFAASTSQAELQDRAAVTNARTESHVVTVRADFTVGEGSETGELSITTEIQDGFHIYAMSQQKPFKATKIQLDESDRFELLEPFKPSRAANVRQHEALDVELHEHEDQITWPGRL